MRALKVLAACLAGSAAAAAMLSALIGSRELLNLFLDSIYGLVLVGRVAMMYTAVYSLTGSELAAVFAGILYNNALAVAALYSSPLVIHFLHTRRWGWPRRMMAGWRLNQLIMRAISAYFISLLGFTMYLAVEAVGFAPFMILEASYAILAAATVYRASRLSAEDLPARYMRDLRVAAPPTALLLVLSALMEAYGIVNL